MFVLGLAGAAGAGQDVRVTDGRGYSSWPMIQAISNRLVCVYSRGTMLSTDNGRTWTQRTVERDLVRADWPTEPSAVCLGDGRILVIARTEWTDGRQGQFQIVSRDWGRTWLRARTNILDVKASTPSLILDPKSGLVSNYYYDRLKGILRRRVVRAADIFDHPSDWPASEVLARGSDAPWESGNANATVCGGSHFIAYYSGHFPVTDVYVHRVRGD